MSDDANDKRARTIAEGKAAWERLKSNQTYDDFMKSAAAVDLVISEMMYESNLNQRSGKRYNQAFSETMAKPENKWITDIPAPMRSKMQACWDNRLDIEEWRKGWSEHQRMVWLAVDTVLREWRKSKKPHKSGEDHRPDLKGLAIESLTEELNKAREIIALRDQTLAAAEAANQQLRRELATEKEWKDASPDELQQEVASVRQSMIVKDAEMTGLLGKIAELEQEIAALKQTATVNAAGADIRREAAAPPLEPAPSQGSDASQPAKPSASPDQQPAERSASEDAPPRPKRRGRPREKLLLRYSLREGRRPVEQTFQTADEAYEWLRKRAEKIGLRGDWRDTLAEHCDKVDGFWLIVNKDESTLDQYSASSREATRRV